VEEVLLHEGTEGLDRLPGIGAGLAAAIRDYVETGRMPLQERRRASGRRWTRCGRCRVSETCWLAGSTRSSASEHWRSWSWPRTTAACLDWRGSAPVGSRRSGLLLGAARPVPSPGRTAHRAGAARVRNPRR
jgi:hypothetical protein